MNLQDEYELPLEFAKWETCLYDKQQGVSVCFSITSIFRGNNTPYCSFTVSRDVAKDAPPTLKRLRASVTLRSFERTSASRESRDSTQMIILSLYACYRGRAGTMPHLHRRLCLPWTPPSAVTSSEKAVAGDERHT